MTGTTTRISYDLNGRPFEFLPAVPSISADGRYVAFAAAVPFQEVRQASLVTEYHNSVVVRDTVAGTTILASVPLGSSPLRDSVAVGILPVLAVRGSLAISGNGRYVAFPSESPNLVAGDNNFSVDYFVRDLVANTTAIVSLNSNEEQASYANDVTNGLTMGTGGVAISPDGRYVAFTSTAVNLVPNDTNNVADLFVRDTVAGTTERVSTDSQGNQQTGLTPSGSTPAISADGRYVAFESISDLVPGDTNIKFDIFVKDRLTGLTTRVSTSSNGTQGTLPFPSAVPGAVSPSLSADGRYVAFESSFDNLVPGDTNRNNDIFVHDRATGTTTRVSTDSNGNQANGNSFQAAISADGRYVSFTSEASNLVGDDIFGAPDVFVKDLLTGLTSRISVNSAGMQAMEGLFGTKSNSPTISGDGRYVAFASNGANLVNDGFNTNTVQIFLRDTRAELPRPTSPGTGVNNPGSNNPTNPSTGSSSNPPTIGVTLIATKAGQRLTGTSGADQFVFRRANRRPNRIAGFEIGQDKIVLTQILDRITPKRYRGNPIQDDYLRFSRRGTGTLVSLDRNGDRTGGIQALVLVENLSVAQLAKPNNFVF